MSSTTVNAEARRNQIVIIAARLFHDFGYHQTSMADIASMANLAKPSLYHYFKSKEQVLAEIHSIFLDPLIQNAEERRSKGLAPEEELREVIFDIVDLNRSHPGFVRVFHEHFRELSKESSIEIRRKRDSFEEHVRQVVDAIIGTEATSHVERRVIVLSLFGVCNWAYHWFRQDGPMDTRQIADLMTEFSLIGLNGFAGAR